MASQPPNKNVETTHTESESKASEQPSPSKPLDAVVEKPAAKTKEEAAKAVKDDLDASRTTP